MTYSFFKKQMGYLSCAFVLGVVSGTVIAETSPVDTSYLNDQSGRVVKSGFNQCWRTGFGPAVYRSECDPNYVPVSAEVTPPPTPPVAEAPKPVIVPVRQKVVLDADMLFDFDKANLRPAGKKELDAFVVMLKEINPEMIVAVGHADRIGSEAYNQRLSEKRVATVKTYLVSKGVDASLISTEGRGETQPVTKADECVGAKSKKIIACLQPNRRVEVDITSTKIAQ